MAVLSLGGRGAEVAREDSEVRAASEGDLELPQQRRPQLHSLSTVTAVTAGGQVIESESAPSWTRSWPSDVQLVCLHREEVGGGGKNSWQKGRQGLVRKGLRARKRVVHDGVSQIDWPTTGAAITPGAMPPAVAGAPALTLAQQ